MNWERQELLGNGILLPKLFWPTVRKNCSSDREELLKFEAEGRVFAKLLRSLWDKRWPHSEFNRPLDLLCNKKTEKRINNAVLFTVLKSVSLKNWQLTQTGKWTA